MAQAPRAAAAVKTRCRWMKRRNLGLFSDVEMLLAAGSGRHKDGWGCVSLANNVRGEGVVEVGIVSPMAD